MADEWKTFYATDTEGYVWLIRSLNLRYALLRLKDFGINAKSIRNVTEEESELYLMEVEIATKHKNIAVFVSKTAKHLIR